IELVVSFRRVAGQDDIRSCMTAAFDSGGHNFLSQFVGLPAPTVESRHEVSLAIAELLVRSAYPGSIRTPEKGAYAARVERWDADRQWRDVDVVSGWDGTVNRIAISNPVARTTEAIVSEF